MNTLINTTLNPLVGILRRSGLLVQDLDYHIVRASMVIMFFFFGYQKWWAYEADRLDPFISNGPLIWWLYPLFGPGRLLVPGCLRMDLRLTAVRGLLGQAAGCARRHRLDPDLHRHRQHHSLHA